MRPGGTKERGEISISFQTHPVGSFRVGWLMDWLIGWSIDWWIDWFSPIFIECYLCSPLIFDHFSQKGTVTACPYDLELVPHCVVLVFWAVKWWVPTCDFATGQQASGFVHFFCVFFDEKGRIPACNTTSILEYRRTWLYMYILWINCVWTKRHHAGFGRNAMDDELGWFKKLYLIDD